MLSRSSSNATDRLRHAKSTSSIHTSASGHQRLHATTNPVVLRRQAETAAVEAYSRARLQDEEISALTSRPRLSRRRSQNTGRSEGSHFADARRRFIQNEAAKPPVHSHHSSPARSDSLGNEETIVTRRMSTIPPAANAVDLAQSPAAHSLRKHASIYTDGSPAPRYSKIDQPTSMLPTDTDGYSGNLAHLSDFSRGGVAQHPRLSKHSPVRDMELDEFQMAQPRRIRQRKSFLGSFQKRNGGFNTALPPFNHADGDIAVPNVGLSLATLPGIGLEHRKNRNFSNTLKDRLKNVFRKASKISMPVQHVHVKDFHFTVRDHDVSEASCPEYTDPFMTVAAEESKPPHQLKFMTAQSATSTAPENCSSSRVTSWANSTSAMSSVRTNNGPFAVPGTHHEPDGTATEMYAAGAVSQTDDPPSLQRSDSNATLRKTSSFFGRPIRNKLRRSSKGDLKGSGESHGLYSALQNRIRTSRSTGNANEIDISAPLDLMDSHTQSESSRLATLPSQRQYSTSSALSSNVSSKCRHGAAGAVIRNRNPLFSTIRPVNPELAPVLEAASAEVDRMVTHHEIESPAGCSPKIALRRSHAIKVPQSSKDQLLKGTERAEQRWTTALATDGLGENMINDPHELPSLSQSHRVQSHHKDHHLVSRANVISPSLYSRATDGASPRPDTPDDIGITTITITGHEVRKYDISPPKLAHQHQTSREWRKWLSNEMNNFTEGEQPSRPASGASMNGRYPIIHRSRNSSQQSVLRRPDSGGNTGMHSMFRGRNASVESAMHTRAPISAIRHRTLSKPKSIAAIESAARSEGMPISDPCSMNTGLGVRSVKAFTRPKSAFELRVNYKNNAADRSKPLEIRRKVTEPSILEEHTMLNIYAGPYASGGEFEHQQPAELEGSGLPALSSSEWLGSTKKGGRQASSKTTPTKHSPQRSPGQRMVTSWLDDKSKENVAAFV